MFRLDDKIALVAGGAGYLGRDICRGLLAQGARVVLTDIDAERTRAAVAALTGGEAGAGCTGLVLDAAQETAIRDGVAEAVERHGRIDVLVNATCAPHGRDAADISGAEFSASLHGNLTGTFLLAREAKAHMPRGGSIVLFSSMYGRVSPDPRLYAPPMNPNPVEYGVAKAGIEQMVRYLAVRWARDGIRVNGVAPGPFPHPATQAAHPDFVQRLCDRVPLGRVGQQHEVTGAALFLASPAASYVTGQVLGVDGGWTAW